MSSTEWLSCRSKLRYRTEGEARQAMANIRRRRSTWTRCYECPYCLGWHLTKTQEVTSRACRTSDTAPVAPVSAVRVVDATSGARVENKENG